MRRSCGFGSTTFQSHKVRKEIWTDSWQLIRLLHMWPNAIILLFCALRCNIRIGRLWAIRCCAVHKSFLFSRLLLTVSTVSICVFTSFIHLLFRGNSFFVSPPLHHNHCFCCLHISALKRTWSERGWCRMERMARDLLRDDGILIQVQVASRPIIVPANTGGVGSASRAPGTGDFTVESDRPRVGRVMNRLMFNKLHSFLQTGTAGKTSCCIFGLFLVQKTYFRSVLGSVFSCVFQDTVNQAREMFFLTPCHKLDNKSPFFTCAPCTDRPGDFHNYRFLSNMQQLCFAGLGVGSIQGLVSGFLPEMDPSTDPEAFVVSRFLHENGFQRVQERDEAGWSPLCYAVLRNDPFLVKALVKSKADVNDRVSKAKKDALLPKKLPILLLAVAYHCNAAMSALLSARANVNIRGALGENAMTSAACVNNHEAVRVLVEAKIDPTAKVFPGEGLNDGWKNKCFFFPRHLEDFFHW